MGGSKKPLPYYNASIGETQSSVVSYRIKLRYTLRKVPIAWKGDAKANHVFSVIRC